ncbi:MAG: asparagine synthase (glutamine-hydrolyzing) [Paracoccaceae bacterium]
MCGIAGIIPKKTIENLVVGFLQHANSIQKNRGPDAQDYMVQNDNGEQIFCSQGKRIFSNPTLGLAHQRLSIIDLNERSNQPMLAFGGKYVLCYNGELYNFRALKEQLQQLGYIFLTASDTEVVLYSMIEWGAEAPSRFVGMFAFSFLNNETGKMLLVRDRIGIKPLHYIFNKTFIAFYSELNTLAQWSHYDPQIDLESFSAGFTFGVGPRPETFFKEIKEVPQGSVMTVDQASGEVESSNFFWRLVDNVNKISETVTTEAISESIKIAVKDRLIADVEVGLCLSAGIDSSLIAGNVKDLNQKLKTFTLYSPRSIEHNELSLARKLADHFSFEHIPLPTHPSDILQDAVDMMYCYQEPFFSLSANYPLFKEIQKTGIKVVLNGLGGDELFGGYKYYSWLNYWKLLRKLPLPKKVLDVDLRFADRLSTILRANRGCEYALAVRNSFTDLDLNNVFGDLMKSASPLGDRYKERYSINEVAFTDEVQEMNFMELMTNVGNHHVHRLDSFSMRFGVEARVPLLDHRLVELGINLDSSNKVQGTNRKLVLRQLCEKLVPKEIMYAPKKGLSLPMDKWMKNELKYFVHDQIEDLKKRHMVDAGGIDRIVKQWKYRSRSYRGVWLLVSFEVWLKQYFDRQKDFLPDYAK